MLSLGAVSPSLALRSRTKEEDHGQTTLPQRCRHTIDARSRADRVAATSLLKPYAQNARTLSERQVALIAQSLETYGFNNPIIAEEDGTIIAGHGRWQAARQLGLASVPVVRVKHLTREKLIAYRLADNRLAELAGWDEEMQVLELGELDSLDLDFSIETTGWTHAEIDVILEPQHCPLSSSERQVRVLHPVFGPAAHLLLVGIAQLVHCSQ